MVLEQIYKRVVVNLVVKQIVIQAVVLDQMELM